MSDSDKTRVQTLTVAGDEADLRARAPITIGDRCTVSQLAVLATEARDPADPDFKTRCAPITMADDSWVAADALVLPGATLHDGAVLGARSVATGPIPAWQIAVGEPARPMRERVIGEEATERLSD